MNDLQIFKNSEFGELEIVMIGGKEYFPAIQCAKILGYSNPYDAISKHCKREGVAKREGVSHTTNQYGATTQQITEIKYIDEGNLYRLIVSSRLPQAEHFERWIFDEVLPSIRKHGLYAVDDIINDPDTMIKALTALKEEREKRKALEVKVEQDKPKVVFANAVECAKTSILVGELAKLLKQNGVQTGEKRLFDDLRNDGYLMKSGTSKNMPTQKSMELGLFEIRERTVNAPDGNIKITKTPYVTGKGQTYFIDRYLKAATC